MQSKVPKSLEPQSIQTSYSFSCCTIVNNWDIYNKSREHFSHAGFTEANSEFLTIDNSNGKSADAFEAIRIFLRAAQGRFIVLVHQDAYPLQPCEILLERLKALERHDPMWGVAGNAGVTKESWPRQIGSLRMPSVSISMRNPFERVCSLDENVLIIRNGTGITVSADLKGFHFYGLDVCSVAARLGFHSYVLDHLWCHDSEGAIDADFVSSKIRLEAKLRDYFSVAGIPTTCTYVCASSGFWQRALASSRSFLQVLPSKRLGKAKRLFWEEGVKNPLFFPALCAVAVVLTSKLVLGKLHRSF